MHSRSVFALIGLILTLSFAQPLPALLKSRPTFRSKEDASLYLIDHYNRACTHYNAKEWHKAIALFEKVAHVFPCSEEASDAYYFLGVSYFELGEYDFSNTAFSNYLKTAGNSKYFEDVIQFKFCIAEHFKAGTKRRLFKIRFCPKWATAKTMALHIYDEIIMAVPNHELAAQSLYSKVCLLQSIGEYYESIDANLTLIRRFPKHELVPQAYLSITYAYYEQSQLDFQNPDILALAQLTVRKFKAEFPRDERVETAEVYVAEIKEFYAKGLYDTGRFYERIGAPAAATIYYHSAIEEFPETRIAELSRDRLQVLPNSIEELEQEGDRKEITASNSPEEPMPFDAQSLYLEFDPLDSNRLLTDQ